MVPKYRLKEVRVKRGDFWLYCQKKLKDMVMELDLESLERKAVKEM